MKEETAKRIYEEIFYYIDHRNKDIFLCGGTSDRGHRSTRDQLRDRLEKQEDISVFYPEDLFMELMNRKQYNMFKLEEFLAENSDLIIVTCESPGSYTELGAFVSNTRTCRKLLALVPAKIKHQRSFLMLGTISYLAGKNKTNPRVIYYNSNLDKLEGDILDFLWLWSPKSAKKKLHSQELDWDFIYSNFLCTDFPNRR